MKKLRQVPRVKQRTSFKQVAVVSGLGMAALAIGFTVFNSGMFHSDIAVASSEKKLDVNTFIKNGDEFFNQEFPEYEQAIPQYEQAIQMEASNAELNYKLGVCYLNSHDKFKAQDYLEKAASLNPNVDAMLHLNLGRSMHLNSEFDDAIKEYYAYLKTCPKDMQDEVTKCIKECRNGKELTQYSANFLIENMGAAVNSKYPEYTPYITADDNSLFFTSRRSDSFGGKTDPRDGKFFEDIYMSEKQGSEWSVAKSLGSPVNTAGHDAIAGLSADGHTMFVFNSAKNEGDIMISKFENGKWSLPQSAGKNVNSKFHESSACLSPDQSTLYFISDRPGGYGGRDIFYSKWDKAKNEWMKAENLGEAINTQYDEESVFIHPDGKTLYFSSKGHNTMGGYDIFTSKLDNGIWQMPANIGSPVNTPDDDVFFTIAANGKGYYASIRKEGFGDKDIYRISFNGKEPDAVAVTSTPERE